jgi:hypothetical protein
VEEGVRGGLQWELNVQQRLFVAFLLDAEVQTYRSY